MTEVNTDQSAANTNQEPNIPELHVPVGSDYRTLKTDIPLEQPMIFILMVRKHSISHMRIRMMSISIICHKVLLIL